MEAAKDLENFGGTMMKKEVNLILNTSGHAFLSILVTKDQGGEEGLPQTGRGLHSFIFIGIFF